MDAPDDVTLGEVHRLLQRVDGHVQDLDSKLDDLNAQRLPARVKSLEDSVTWLVRIVVGAVIASVLGMVLVSGGVVV